MMYVKIEFVGHVRTLAEERQTVIVLDEDVVSLGSALSKAEHRYKNLRLFDEGRLVKGVLVFRRRAAGGLERIDDLDLPAVEEGKSEEEYVIATAMEGG